MFADIDKVIIHSCPEKQLIGAKGFSVLVDLIDEEHLLGAFKKDLGKRILLLPIDKNEKLILPVEIVNIIEYYGRRFYVFNEKGAEFYYTYQVRWFDDYSSLIWINHSKYFERSKEIREEVEEVCEPYERIEEEEEMKGLSEVLIEIIEERIDEKISKELDKKIDFLIGESLKKSAGLKTRMRMGDE